MANITSRKVTALEIVGLFLLLMVPGAVTDEKSQWLSARQTLSDKGTLGRPEVRLEATKGLVDAIYPPVEAEAAGLLVTQITNEISRGGSAARESLVNEDVLDTCVTGLRKLTNEKAVDNIIKAAKNTALPWRVRFYVLKGLAAINQSTVISALVELLNDKDARVKEGALSALGELKAKDGVEPACKILNSEEAWEAKIAAAEYLGKLNDQTLIEPLIRALEGKNLDGRCRAEVVKVLTQLTGEDLGLNATSWRQWWTKKNNPNAAEPAKQTEETIAVTAVYYGVKETSTRIIFIMDISGSMDWGAEWKEEPEETKTQIKPKFTGDNGKPADDKDVDKIKKKKEEVDKRPVSKRIQAAQRELINTIYNLDHSVYFTIIFFSGGVRAWKETLVPATIQNKTAAIDEINKQVPNGSTATFDALEMAYRIGQDPSGKNKPAALDKKGYAVDQLGGADTIFFVTDGVPTSGKIMDPAAIVKEIQKINETRKIKINTVGVGTLKGVPAGVTAQDATPNIKLLGDLAQVTGGVFVDKTK